jgi:hypothetical protein
VAEPPAPRRTFTVAEANAAIPLLAERIDRLRALRDEIRRGREYADILWERLDAGEAVLGAIGEREGVLGARQAEFAQLLKAIEATGIVLRDLDPGLADFPSAVRGLPIFLCWRAGETRIGFWHGLHNGFAGRKPISTIDDRSNPSIS